MPLQNFGSILNFAEELESQDRQFYEAAAGNPACGAQRALFSALAAEAGRSVQTVQRIRREYVTEMILEPIRDFTRAPFCEACEGAGWVTVENYYKAIPGFQERGRIPWAGAPQGPVRGA